MPRRTDCIALLMLGALALVTAIYNVRASHHCYVTGAALRETEDCRQAITHDRARCRTLLRTEVVANLVEDLGLTDDDLYPPVFTHEPPWGAPLARGSQ